MLQTIDRALTIYGNMSLEEQHMFLQAELAPLSKELQKLSTECFDIMKTARKMNNEIRRLTPADYAGQTTHDMNHLRKFPPNIHTYSIEQILEYVGTQCKMMYETHPMIIPTDRVPIFLSAMMYYIYGKLDSTLGKEPYPIIQQYCSGVTIPQIYHTKCPTTAEGVMRLVNSRTETFKTISTETTIPAPKNSRTETFKTISTSTPSRCTIS
jgi:hypothetical protein